MLSRGELTTIDANQPPESGGRVPHLSDADARHPKHLANHIQRAIGAENLSVPFRNRQVLQHPRRRMQDPHCHRPPTGAFLLLSLDDWDCFLLPRLLDCVVVLFDRASDDTKQLLVHAVLPRKSPADLVTAADVSKDQTSGHDEVDLLLVRLAQPRPHTGQERTGEGVCGQERVLGGDIADVLDERIAGVGDEFLILLLRLGVYREGVEPLQQIEGLREKVERDEVVLEVGGGEEGREEGEEGEEVVETAVRGGGEGNENGER